MYLIRKLWRAFALALPAVALLKQYGDKRLVVELAMLGELPCILPLLRNVDQLPGTRLILMPNDPRDVLTREFQEAINPIRENFTIMSRDDVQSLANWFQFDGFLTSEQFSEPLLRPAICIFHGQPSKGITFSNQVLERFDHFFHLGPLHRQALDEFIESEGINPSNLPQSHEVGYAKSDDVIRTSKSAASLKSNYRWSGFEKVILYAPAFNQFCTLRTIGMELIKTLAGVPGAGVIVKLAPDSIGRTDSFYATGGVDWRLEIKALGLENVFVATELDINPSIVVSDVMVTDVSGVGYEFLACGKPVIYYECPQFYENIVLPNCPHLTIAELLKRDTINGGRSYGTLVRNLDQLRTSVSEPIPVRSPDEMQELLLYNPGRATQAMVQTLARILD